MKNYLEVYCEKYIVSFCRENSILNLKCNSSLLAIFCLKFLKSRNTLHSVSWGIMEIREVKSAQLVAMETPQAKEQTFQSGDTDLSGIQNIQENPSLLLYYSSLQFLSVVKATDQKLNQKIKN